MLPLTRRRHDIEAHLLVAYGLITILTAVLITLLVIVLRAAAERRRRRQGYLDRRRIKPLRR